ncbi:MAG: PAS domain S-box protein [bacterium]|nr:PAS domain S-box protein [bacterium]
MLVITGTIFFNWETHWTSFLILLAVSGLMGFFLLGREQRSSPGPLFKHSISLYEDLFTHSSEAICVLDDQGNVKTFNIGFRDLVGLPGPEIIGRDFLEFIHPGDHEDVLYSESPDSSTHTRQLQLRMFGKNGRFRTVRVNERTLLQNDRVTGYQIIARDITEQRRAEAVLRESEKKYRSLYDNMSEGVTLHQMIYDDSGNAVDYIFLEVNPAFESISGIARRQLTGQKASRIFDESPPPYLSVFAHVATDGNPISFDGHYSSWNKVFTISAYSPSPGRVAAVFEDVTDRRMLEDQLRQAQKMDAVGQLAGGIAHDFNNLLQAIIGYTQLGIGSLSPGEKSYSDFEQVQKAAVKASALTRQLLLFSRRQVLEPAQLVLNTIIKDLSKMLRRIIGAHIKLNLRLLPELKPIYADPTTIDQLLMNLCINARDAMPDGGEITIKTENLLLSQSLRAGSPWLTRGDYVLLTVSDTGTGMTPEIVEHIFEPFFTTKEIGKGTGLGLSTVYGIIKQHNGLIRCQSEPGKGTRFKIFLPVSHRETGGQGETGEPRTNHNGNETILLAEDDVRNRELAARVLRERGYTVLEAADGLEALEIFGKHSDTIDLAVMDLVMPRLGGREAHDRINAIKPGIPFIFISGYHPGELSHTFTLDEGMTLIQKPYETDVFLKKIRKILDSKI